MDSITNACSCLVVYTSFNHVSRVQNTFAHVICSTCYSSSVLCPAAPGMSYEAGDHVAVFGENIPEVVERACKALGYSPSTLFTITLPNPNPGMLDHPFPSPTTLQAALTHHCELQQQPDREAIRTLAGIATDETEAVKLLQLLGEGELGASVDVTYASYITKQERSILDVLEVRTSTHNLREVTKVHRATAYRTYQR